MFMLYSIFSQCLLLQVLAKGAWAEKDLCVFRELDFRCNKTFGILVHFVFSILYFTHKSNLWYSHTYMRERTLCLHLFILLISFYAFKQDPVPDSIQGFPLSMFCKILVFVHCASSSKVMGAPANTCRHPITPFIRENLTNHLKITKKIWSFKWENYTCSSPSVIFHLTTAPFN